MSFTNSGALRKIRHTAGICHRVLVKRCANVLHANVAVDSMETSRSDGRLFHTSGLKTAKLLQQMAIAVHCTLSLLAADDLSCQHTAR